MLGERRGAAAKGIHNAPKRLLGGDLLRARVRELADHWHWYGERAVATRALRHEWHAGEKGLEALVLNIESSEAFPLGPRCDVHLLSERLHLLVAHEPGVVVLVPRKRQPEALDGVGDEAMGALAFDGMKGV